MRKLIISVFALMAFALSSLAQNVTVTGTILDASDGQPLAGVGVIPSTGGGTVTDFDGKYQISVPKNASLTFSSLGYESVTEAVNGRAVINLSMNPDSQILEDVVVMGYTTQKKAEISSAVVTMSGEKLHDVVTPDVGNMLQGKVAGVLVYNSSGQPGESAQIRVRGTGSISASADPLYVVDGIPGGSFNPNDVETISVLKDAGATAIYGSDAAGGVIVVTTKKAKAGQNTVVELKAQAGVKQALSGRFRPMNSAEVYEMCRSLNQEVMAPSMFKKAFPESLKERDFSWMDASFKLGVTQNYYASVAGSAERITYFASLDHYREKGTLINTNYNRTTGRLNLGAKLFKNLDLNIRLQFDDSNTQGASSYVTLESAYRMSPWDSPYDADGNIQYVPQKGLKWYSHDKFNIFQNELYNSDKSNGHDITGDLQAIWRITDFLSFTSTNRYSTSASTWKSVIDPRTAIADSGGTITKVVSTGRSFSTSNLLKYSQVFGGEHSVNAMVGWEWSKWKNDNTTAEGVGLKGGLTVLNAAAPSGVGGYFTEGESWSVFGQAQYSFREKYILTASVRADASSVFAPQHRIGVFPSVSGAWLASSEEFMKNAKAISLLKVRASFGQTGNSGIEPYAYFATFAASPRVQYQGVVGMYPDKMENMDLHWERASMTNLGIDLGINNRVEFNLDLYHILNDDLLLDVPTSPSTGFTSITKNSGAVRNMGVELNISSTNINKKNFTWTTGFNIGFNKNTVVSIPNGEPIVQSVGSNSARQIIVQGESLYSWYMPKWAGVDPENGDPLWWHLIKDENENVIGQEKTNVFNPDDDSQIVGCASPLFSGGLVNNFRLGQFSLAINLNYVVGNKIFNYTRVTMDTDGHYSTDYNQMSIDNGLGWTRWQQPGDIATHPKALPGGNKNSDGVSSRYLEDGSFLRIKNVTLAYDLPKNFLKKIHMQEARVFISGDNLWTLTAFSGMDPEVRLESTMYELAGMYSMNYPVGRVVSLGVNVKF